MAGRFVPRPRAAAGLVTASVDDPATQRAIDAHADAIQALQTGRKRFVVESVDLVVGTNVIRHGLGRAAVGYTLVPTTADATFAHALDATNPRPELEVWIAVVGIAQNGARLEIW